MRRSELTLGPEEWQIALLKKTASPAASGSETASSSSRGASIRCSRVSRLAVPKHSRCGSLPAVGAGDYAEAAGVGATVGKRERGDRHDRPDVAIGGVLMPAGEGPAVGLLEPERDAPHQQVGAEQVLHRVEQAGVAGELVDPRAEQRGALVEHVALPRPAPLESLQQPAVALRRARAHGPQRPAIARVAKTPPLRLAQPLRHRPAHAGTVCAQS